MLKDAPPQSNLERQREFRKRNLGYYRRYRASRKLEMMHIEQGIAAATKASNESAAISLPTIPSPEPTPSPSPEFTLAAMAA